MGVTEKLLVSVGFICVVTIGLIICFAVDEINKMTHKHKERPQANKHKHRDERR